MRIINFFSRGVVRSGVPKVLSGWGGEWLHPHPKGVMIKRELERKTNGKWHKNERGKFIYPLLAP